MTDTLWVTVGLVIFLIIVFGWGRKSMFGVLDRRIERVRSELEEARRLREEAQGLLAEYSRKREAARSESEGIVNQARREAERMERQAEEQLSNLADRRREQAMQQIAQAEADAVREVRTRAVDVAVSAAREVIAAHVSGDAARRMIDSSIEELPGKLRR